MSSFVSFSTGGSMLSGRGVLGVGVRVSMLGPLVLVASPSIATPPSTVENVLTAGESGPLRA